MASKPTVEKKTTAAPRNMPSASYSWLNQGLVVAGSGPGGSWPEGLVAPSRRTAYPTADISTRKAISIATPIDKATMPRMFFLITTSGSSCDQL